MPADRAPWSTPIRPARRRSVDTLLERVCEVNASDLHLTAGSKPAMRLHGHIELLEDFPELDPDMTRELIYRITTEQQKRLEIDRALDFAYGLRGSPASSTPTTSGARSPAPSASSRRTSALEELGLPSSAARARDQAARPRPAHRPHRLR